MDDLLIQNGRVIDPANGVDEIRDVLVVNGRIADAASGPAAGSGAGDDQAPAVRRMDARGRVVCPGLIDIHVHLREPGRSDKETIESGTQAAARGGFTSVVCMPNTTPPADNAGTVEYVKARAREKGIVNVFPSGAITVGLKGEQMAEIGSLKRAGVVAITDDGHCVQNNEIMRRSIEYAKMFELAVLDHCQDFALSSDGVAHEGYWSMILGLRGWPAIAEEIIVARNCLLAEFCEWKVHMQHVSSKGSVRILHDARRRGAMVSGEVCPHHIALTDESIKGYDTNFKMNPPLREKDDVEALLQGIADGVIEILASDHAPHCSFEKEVEFDDAPFGVIGLETELGIFLTELVHKKVIPLPKMIAMFTVHPARLLGLDRGALGVGAKADITILDPDREWVVDREQSASQSRNTPFHGRPLKGKAVTTIVGGKVVWEEG
ncbi:MAG: dihydroorotase [Verrucomicrobia bacterium]|nr:dihydroorotase [Verrucomicrobiota bacterium]